jgi:hypothetical protein
MTNENLKSPVLAVAPGSAGFPVLAHKSGIGLMIGLLIRQGAMCPKCGYGTKATSKRWAVCKRCGERTERRSLPNAKLSHPDQASKLQKEGE